MIRYISTIIQFDQVAKKYVSNFTYIYVLVCSVSGCSLWKIRAIWRNACGLVAVEQLCL